MTEAKKFTIICPASYRNKVAVIKAIRILTGLGLLEAKGASEIVGTEQVMEFDNSVFTTYPAPNLAIEEQFRIMRNEGVVVGGSVHVLLDDLRKLATEALKQGEDELANEILQLVLVEKLRRNTTF